VSRKYTREEFAAIAATGDSPAGYPTAEKVEVGEKAAEALPPLADSGGWCREDCGPKYPDTEARGTEETGGSPRKRGECK